MLQLLAERGPSPAFPPASSATPRPTRPTLAGPLLPPRTVVFLGGLAGSPHYRVVDGYVATAQTLSDGRRQIIDLGPGRLIGLGLGEHTRYSAETLCFTRLEAVSDTISQSERDLALSEMLACSRPDHAPQSQEGAKARGLCRA